jgi:hypothetical protein
MSLEDLIGQWQDRIDASRSYPARARDRSTRDEVIVIVPVADSADARSVAGALVAAGWIDKLHDPAPPAVAGQRCEAACLMINVGPRRQADVLVAYLRANGRAASTNGVDESENSWR